MLIIPREKGQGIVIDHDIVLTVVDIQEDEIRLEIRNPSEVTVQELEAGGTMRQPVAAAQRPR